MLDFLCFLITISVLVIVHEYGHYLVARLFNVKVLTFSIGFGPKLFSIHSKNNEWRISAILLGGYVRMLDERDGEVNESEKCLAFNRKKPYQKILIAAAGPLFNILFAVVAYYFVAITGVVQIKPIVASVDSKVIAANHINLDLGSQIIKINNNSISTWADAEKQFTNGLKKQGYADLLITLGKSQYAKKIDLATLAIKNKENIYLEDVGLYPIRYLPVISYIEPGSSASSAKLKINDEIVAINGKLTTSWFLVTDIIHNSPSEKLFFVIKRGSKLFNVTVIPESISNDGQIIGRVGIMPTIDQQLLEKNSYLSKYSPISAINYAFKECYNIVVLNLTGIYQLISGQVSIYNLAGPISIAKAGKMAMAVDFKHFIDFLALISLGLAIMNLLPIPVLDGGHIILYTFEWLFKREVAYSIQNFAFKAGFVIILGLSLFAIYNDLLRL